MPCNPVAPRTPPGWARTTLGEAYIIVGGGTPSTDHPEYWDGSLPWISSADIHGVTDVSPRRAVTPEGLRNSAASVVPKGSIIVVTRVGLGKVAKAPTDICFSQDSQALVGASGQVLPDYALYYLSQALQSFKHQGRGTTINGVTKKQLKEVLLALPPFPEQRRIVAKIEELFSQLDAGVEELKKAKAQLKRYRQSVLKAAFEGKLTEEWRRQRANSHKPIEPATGLLERIKAERKKALGSKYKDPPPLDTSDLPELPEGWGWARVGEVATVSGGKRLPKGQSYADAPSKHAYIRVVDFASMSVDTTDLRYLKPETHEAIHRYTISSRDLYVSIAGTIGKVGLIPDSLDGANLTENAAKIADITGVDKGYLCLVLNGRFCQDQICRLTISSNQPKLALFRIEQIAFSLVSRFEQKEVVQEVERRLSIADAEEKAIEAALKQAARLRQSILKRAFEGKLVPQDPSDEPAEKLLERIRAEKAKRTAGQPRGRRTTKAGR